MRAAAPQPSPGVWQVVAVLVAFLVVRYAHALTAPFFSDDYLFFDKLADAPFRTVWVAQDLAYQWYRPWSRELHYWVFYRLFGLNPLPYHLAAFVLWLAAMSFYWMLVVRIAGRAAATLACAGIAALAAWNVLLEWSPGVQDLWMLAWGLGALVAFAHRRTAWATIALAFALISKESAAIVPALALGYAGLIDSDTPRAALRRVAPMLALVVVWAVLHPSLGGQLWWARESPALHEVQSWPLDSAIRSVLAVLNLDLALRPLDGWWRSILVGLPGALLLAALVAFALFRTRRSAAPVVATEPAEVAASRESAPAPGDRVVAFGALWAVAGMLPMLAPSVLWQPYYGLLCALGVWLAISTLLIRVPVAAVAVVFTVAMLAGLRSETPSRDWGNALLQRFGKTFMTNTESYLKQRFPTLPRHTRLYFTSVPRGVVFVTGRNDAPALRVWFRDPTVMGSFWSDYRPRGPGDSIGGDYFFRYDSLRGWLEVVKGPENTDSMRALDPQWQSAHERLARILVQAGDIDGAIDEFEKLASVDRSNPEFAFLAGMAHEARGDSAAAAPWYRRAASLPGAGEDMKARARRFGAVP